MSIPFLKTIKIEIEKQLLTIFDRSKTCIMFSTIRLEDYFEFHSADDIRIKGHRIGIEDVLRYYLSGYRPEEIKIDLPSLNLEKIHATITFYLHNKVKIDDYLRRLELEREQNYQKFIANPPAVIQKLQREKVRRNLTRIESE